MEEAIASPPYHSPPGSEIALSTMPRSVGQVLMLVLGGILLTLSFVVWTAYVILPFLYQSSDNGLRQNALLASIGALMSVNGALLLVAGWRRPRSIDIVRAPPHLFIVFPILFFISLLLGQGALWLSSLSAWAFPPFHVLASLLSSVTILAFAAPRLANSSARSLAVGFAWGGVGTVIIAFVSEIVLGVLFVLFGAVGAVALLGQDGIRELSALLRSNPSQLDLPRLAQLLEATPWVLVLIGGLVVIFLSLLVPLIEESTKAMLPIIRISRQSITMSQALWWALCAGAGYAFSENLLNGLNALEFWSIGMGLRGGTSFMHIATTGTVGLAFFGGFIERRYRRMIALFVLAISMHGFWNLTAISVSVAAVAIGARSFNSIPQELGVLLFSLISILVVLIACSLLWIIFLVRWSRQHDSNSYQSSEHVSMIAS